MERITDQQRLKPWMGFALFAVVMAVFLTVCAWMQTKWGMTGLVLTEILFLAIAVGFCLIRKVKIKEVFPIKKITARDFFGCLFLLMAGNTISIIVTLLTAYFLPSAAAEVTELSDFLYSGNAILSIFIVTVTPAICEEAIHRGAILSNFRSIKKDWIIILIMGILFGLNHVSILRFGATAILGAVLSYVVVKRNNILLSMLIHFGNNLIAACAGIFSAKSQATVDPSSMKNLSSLGIYLILGMASPILLTLGMMLINPKGHRKIRFLFAGIISAVMLVTGIILFTGNLSEPIVNSTISYTVTDYEETEPEMQFGVVEEKDYSVAVVVTCSKDASYRFRLTSSDGTVILDEDLKSGSPLRTYSGSVRLPVDEYSFWVDEGEGSVGDKPQIQVTIR